MRRPFGPGSTAAQGGHRGAVVIGIVDAGALALAASAGPMLAASAGPISARPCAGRSA